MLSWKVTSTLLSQVQRGCLHGGRTYRILASKSSCTVPDNDDSQKNRLSSPHRWCILLNRKSDNHKCFYLPKTFTSKSTDSTPEQADGNSDPEQADNTANPELSNKEDPVKLLYTFPYIRNASLMTKLKIFQTLFIAGTFPIVYNAYLAGEVSLAELSLTFCIFSFAVTFLYVIGEKIRKIVCIMKYNKETDEVLIAHITFWGRRRDVIIPVSNIIPLSDTNEKVNDFYVRINTYDKSEQFDLILKFLSEAEKKEILDIIG